MIRQFNTEAEGWEVYKKFKENCINSCGCICTGLREFSNGFQAHFSHFTADYLYSFEERKIRLQFTDIASTIEDEEGFDIIDELRKDFWAVVPKKWEERKR